MATGSPKAKGSLQLDSPREEKRGSVGWGRGVGGSGGDTPGRVPRQKGHRGSNGRCASPALHVNEDRVNKE